MQTLCTIILVGFFPAMIVYGIVISELLERRDPRNQRS
jgi:hypothetical protein